MADAVCAALGLARALRRCGRVVDLEGLDSDLGRLCAYALDLPPEDGRSFRPRLLAIRSELDILAKTIVPSEAHLDP